MRCKYNLSNVSAILGQRTWSVFLCRVILCGSSWLDQISARRRDVNKSCLFILCKVIPSILFAFHFVARISFCCLHEGCITSVSVCLSVCLSVCVSLSLSVCLCLSLFRFDKPVLCLSVMSVYNQQTSECN